MKVDVPFYDPPFLPDSEPPGATFDVGPRAEGGQIDLRIFKNKE